MGSGVIGGKGVKVERWNEWLSCGILCEKVGSGEIVRRGDDGTGLIWEEVMKLLDTYKPSGSSSSGARSKTFRVEPWRARHCISSNAYVEAALRHVRLEQWSSSHLHPPRGEL